MRRGSDENPDVSGGCELTRLVARRMERRVTVMALQARFIKDSGQEGPKGIRGKEEGETLHGSWAKCASNTKLYRQRAPFLYYVTSDYETEEAGETQRIRIWWKNLQSIEGDEGNDTSEGWKHE